MIVVLKNIKQEYAFCFDIEHDDQQLVQLSGILLKRLEGDQFIVIKSLNFYVKNKKLSNFFVNFTCLPQVEINQYGLSLEELDETLIEFFKDIKQEDTIWVSHGLINDLTVLRMNDIDLLPRYKYCTYNNAKRLIDRPNKLSLCEIAREACCGLGVNHNAYTDAIATMWIFSYLLQLETEVKK